jgi:DNA-binding transcriptional MerR regulator
MALTVSEVSKLSGVTVRTLHHYDEIGLLRPSSRSRAGYRLYGDQDLQRLQQILFFRELEFPLEEILRILRDPDFDLHSALVMQRQLLSERAVKVRALIEAVDAALESLEKGTVMTKEEMFEVFGDFDPAKYEEEARQRWGHTEAYKESARRTKRYGKKEWAAIKAESGEALDEMVKLMKAGRKPEDPAAMDAAEKQRLSIDRWFYPCSHQMHRMLGEMYLQDERFTQFYERIAPGLARYNRDAIVANADRAAAAAPAAGK